MSAHGVMRLLANWWIHVGVLVSALSYSCMQVMEHDDMTRCYITAFDSADNLLLFCTVNLGAYKIIFYFQGFVKTIETPGCLDATVQLNACSGYCESFSFPQIVGDSGGLRVVMRGSCCSMVETHDVSIFSGFLKPLCSASEVHAVGYETVFTADSPHYTGSHATHSGELSWLCIVFLCTNCSPAYLLVWCASTPGLSSIDYHNTWFDKIRQVNAVRWCEKSQT